MLGAIIHESEDNTCMHVSSQNCSYVLKRSTALLKGAIFLYSPAYIFYKLEIRISQAKK